MVSPSLLAPPLAKVKFVFLLARSFEKLVVGMELFSPCDFYDMTSDECYYPPIYCRFDEALVVLVEANLVCPMPGDPYTIDEIFLFVMAEEPACPA